MSVRRCAASVELSARATWVGARGLVGFLLAYQLLLQHLPQARDLDVGAFFGPARIRDAGRGAGVDTLGDVHAGGGAVVGVPGSAAAHLGPLAPVVADAVPADATVAGLGRALHATAGRAALSGQFAGSLCRFGGGSADAITAVPDAADDAPDRAASGRIIPRRGCKWSS